MSKVVVQSHVGEIKAELRHRIPTILEALGLEAEGNAVTEIDKLVYDTPPSDSYVRTGRLRGSITHTVDDDSAIIGTDVEYGVYVEMGTYKMASRPFLRNAIENYVDDYKNIVEAGLQ